MYVHHDHSRRIIIAVGLAATLVAALAHHPLPSENAAHPPTQIAVAAH